MSSRTNVVVTLACTSSELSLHACSQCTSCLAQRKAPSIHFVPAKKLKVVTSKLHRNNANSQPFFAHPRSQATCHRPFGLQLDQDICKSSRKPSDVAIWHSPQLQCLHISSILSLHTNTLQSQSPTQSQINTMKSAATVLPTCGAKNLRQCCHSSSLPAKGSMPGSVRGT